MSFLRHGFTGISLTLGLLGAGPASAQSARAIKGPTPLLAIPDEAPPRLILDSPVSEALARGAVFVQYRAENMRILPVFGPPALAVSPRIGHVHVTVDDHPWHFVDTSGETIIVVGLEPGLHHLLVELADPTHHVVDRKTLTFTIPKTAPASRGH